MNISAVQPLECLYVRSLRKLLFWSKRTSIQNLGKVKCPEIVSHFNFFENRKALYSLDFLKLGNMVVSQPPLL